MTEASTPAVPVTASPLLSDRPIPPRGWLVIAAKEFGDHIESARFLILLLVLGLSAGLPLYLATDSIRQLASQASGAQAVFLALFWFGPQDQSIFAFDVSVQGFVALAAPLLGIGFAFDAVNGERSRGTLPRLVSQPIYRDDVINGKFVAALAVITLVLVSVVLALSALGLIRLGIAPALSEVLRIALWLVVTIVYVGLWLALGTLISVVVQRAATAALIGLGAWLLLAVFGNFIVRLFINVFLPISATASLDQRLFGFQVQDFVLRLLPVTLYTEATTVLLDPTATSVATLSTLGQYDQQAQQLPSFLALDQSLLLVWPHVVVMVALTALLFAAAYIRFMRQEVRA